MFLLIVTLLLLLSALYFDLRYQFIPNKLCLAGLLAAFALQAYSNQWLGLGQAILGASAALALLLPAYYFRYLGAGDVKLMLAVGAFSGPTLLFWSVVFGLIFGTFTSFFIALYKVGWSGFIKMISRHYIYSDSDSDTDSKSNSKAVTSDKADKSKVAGALQVPYAPALALGWLLACALSPEIGPEIAAAIAPEIEALLSSIKW